MTVYYKKLEEDAIVPKQENFGDAADLFSVEDVAIEPGEAAVVRSGIALQTLAFQKQNAIGFFYRIWMTPRSGLAAKNYITLLNTPGLIDPSYTGELKAIMYNSGKETYLIKKGDKIAQLSFERVQLEDAKINFETTEELLDTTRGSGGFGSTGR